MSIKEAPCFIIQYRDGSASHCDRDKYPISSILESPYTDQTRYYILKITPCCAELPCQYKSKTANELLTDAQRQDDIDQKLYRMIDRLSGAQDKAKVGENQTDDDRQTEIMKRLDEKIKGGA